MNIRKIIYSVTLLLSACNVVPELPANVEIPNPTPTPTNTVPITPAPSTPTPTPIPTPTPSVDLGTGGLKVVIQQSNNFTSNDRVRLEEARALLERTLNTEEFKQRVLHFTYDGEETFVQNDGYSNLEIYNLIMAGAEQYPKATSKDQVMDLFTELYYGSSGVIGYTNPNTSTIYMNSYYFSSYEPCDIAGNMMHEWLHKLGFDHDYNSTYRRPYSVPYAIGYIIEELTSK